jgi:hypothetical protein
MKQDDKQALKEFLVGAAVAIGITVVFLSLFFTLSRQISEAAKNTPNSVKVVDTYKGCDIVEWNYGPLARYQYFLYCNEN